MRMPLRCPTPVSDMRPESSLDDSHVPAELTDVIVRAVLTQIADTVPIAKDFEPLTATARGATGHVVGIRSRTGRRVVVKMFPAAVADRAGVEAAALRIAGGLPGVPVPDVLA